MRQRILSLDLWKYGILLLWGGTPEQADAKVKDLLGWEFEDSGPILGKTYMNRGGVVVWVKELDPTILSHELLHAVAFVMRERGLKFSRASEEAYTYTLEHLLKQALSKKRKRKA